MDKKGYSLRGFYTEEIRKGGKRVGFKLITYVKTVGGTSNLSTRVGSADKSLIELNQQYC